MPFSDLNDSGQSKCFTVVGRITKETDSNNLNLMVYILMSLNLRVDEAANIPLKAAKLLAASSF